MPAMFERSADTDLIVNLLRKVNGEIEYTQIAKMTGLAMPRVKDLLRSARKILRRENILFGTIIGVGLKRLSDLDKARKTESVKKRIAQTATRELKDLATIEHEQAMPLREQLMVTTNRTVLTVIQGQARIKAAAPDPQAAQSAPLPATVMLDELKKKGTR